MPRHPSRCDATGHHWALQDNRRSRSRLATACSTAAASVHISLRTLSRTGGATRGHRFPCQAAGALPTFLSLNVDARRSRQWRRHSAECSTAIHRPCVLPDLTPRRLFSVRGMFVGARA